MNPLLAALLNCVEFSVIFCKIGEDAFSFRLMDVQNDITNHK